MSLLVEINESAYILTEDVVIVNSLNQVDLWLDKANKNNAQSCTVVSKIGIVKIFQNKIDTVPLIVLLQPNEVAIVQWHGDFWRVISHYKS